MKANLESNRCIGPEMDMKDLDHTWFYFINPNGISLEDNGVQFKGRFLSLVQGPLVGRKISSGEDASGRWTYTKFASENNMAITVMSVYQ
eukprot:6108370-Ditylum_brightwellii.AAC.1